MLGLTLSLFLLVSATTGILLALKKEVAIIQPTTQKGLSSNMTTWKSMADLSTLGAMAFYEKYPEQTDNVVSKIDVRPSKGIVKLLFEKGQWEVQLDAQSGKVLSIARRHSDWIEALHDGSIISDLFKLISMNFLGIGVIVLLGSGVWLWYGPKEFRKLKRKRGQGID